MKKYALLLAALALAGCAQAQVQIKDPWVRGTVAQQTATGAFMQIQSATDAKLMAAASPVAGVVEVHEMAMDGNVMKMRAVQGGLDLPAGKTVDLKPGGYHIMLMDLKKTLAAGETVPVTLTIEGRDKKTETIQVQAPVKAGVPKPAADGHAMPMHKH